MFTEIKVGLVQPVKKMLLPSYLFLFILFHKQIYTISIRDEDSLVGYNWFQQFVVILDHNLQESKYPVLLQSRLSLVDSNILKYQTCSFQTGHFLLGISNYRWVRGLPAYQKYILFQRKIKHLIKYRRLL